ncbi:MAG: hypothetical protein PHU08_03095 [Dehalococcoidales bacterium]|nr:hypothetical protein [Dehalococcoidales bacterium]
MRSLTPTLLTAQKESSRIPCVKVEASNRIAGVVRLDWERLYTGTEDDYFHALTIPGDGSLIRVRITLPSDSRKLYRQRVADPGPESDFSQWTYCNQYDAVIVASCSLGVEVSIFWIKSDRTIYRIKSTDYGVNWGAPELIDYSPTTAIYGIAAAYKPDGDLALFFADQSTLYVKKCVAGQWQNKAAWDKSTGDLSGVAAIYDGDWYLFVTGKDSSGNFKLWSLVYGDGGEVVAGTWSALKEFASAPAGAGFEFHRAFMDKPDGCRCFFVEKFTGTQAYSRPYWSHLVLDTGFIDNRWREPVPFNLSSEYGLAMAHYGDYGWLSTPGGVWRARLTAQSLDLTADVLSLRLDLGEDRGGLAVELRDDDGRYNAPGSGGLSVIVPGCQLAISPGYVTSQGNEVSLGLTFWLDAWEQVSAGGKASLVLYASDGWSRLKGWSARHQFRWNKAGDEMSIKDIIALVLARVGARLEVVSASAVIAGFFPDFTIHPDNRGDTIIRRLLSFVPDKLFFEGQKAYLINPQPADSSVYAYGTAHPVLEGRYRTVVWESNRVQVEGYDPVGGESIVVDTFDWSEIDRVYDRLDRIIDRNIGTVADAQARGEACLRWAEIGSAGGLIRIPVNCGQQLYDVIDVTDSRAGLSAAKKRVLGIVLSYVPRRGEYEQRLSLGEV